MFLHERVCHRMLCLFGTLSLLGGLVSGCLGSSCPLPVAGAVSITPASPCLVASVSACIGAVLNIENKCTEPLLLPTSFAVYSTDASAEEFVTVKPGSNVHFEVRKEKATSRTPVQEAYEIPGKLGTTDLLFAFSIMAELK